MELLNLPEAVLRQQIIPCLALVDVVYLDAAMANQFMPRVFLAILNAMYIKSALLCGDCDQKMQWLTSRQVYLHQVCLHGRISRGSYVLC